MMKRFLSLWQGDGGRTLALTVGSPSAHRRCAMLKPLFLAMLFLIAGIGNAWGTKNVSGTYKLVTSVTGIAANDTVILVNKAGDYALTGISTTSTKYGLRQSVSASNNVITLTNVDVEELLVEAGYSTGTFSFKGTGDIKTTSGNTTTYNYLYWTSGNSLNQDGTKSNNTSWILRSYNSTNGMTIKNKQDTARILRYNTTSNQERFACYTSSTGTLVNLYKKFWLVSIAVKTAPTTTTYTAGEYFNPAGLVITKTYSDNSKEDITYNNTTKNDFTFSPNLTTALTTGNTSVTITYGGKSVNQAITVNASGCTNEISLSKGSETNGAVTSISSSSFYTCSETAADRQVTIVITPAECFDAPAELTYTGDGTATKVSKTDNGNGTFSYVYQFAQNDNGSGTFGVTCTAKAAGKTVTFDAGPGVPAETSLTETCDGSGVTLPSVNASGVCKGWGTFVGWRATAITDSTTTNAGTLYTAGTKFTPSSDGQTLYAVYSKTKSGAGASGNTLITPDTLSLGSYGDGTNKGIYKWSFTQLMLGQSSIQGNSSKSSILWNTTAFPAAITKVELVVGYAAGTNNTAALSFGTSAKPTSNNLRLGKDTDYDLTSTGTLTIIQDSIPANSTYMSLTWTSGASYYSSIKVYYGNSSTTYYCSDPNCCTELASIKGSFNVSSKTQKSVTLGWANETTASDVDHYELSYVVKGSSDPATVVKNDIANNVSSYTVNNLQCNTEYTFTLDAIGNAHCNAQETKDVTTNKYTITASGVGGGLVLDPSATSVCDGDVITLTATTPDGSHEGNGTIKVVKTGVVPEEDVTSTVYNVPSAGKLTMPAYDITITTTYAEKQSPSVGVSVSSMNFNDPSSPKKGDAVAAKTFNLTGSALTVGTLTLVAPTGYTVSPSSIEIATAGALSATEITVTPVTTNAGEFNGNISISGAGVEETNIVALSMTVQETYTVNWYVNGGSTPVHSQTDVANTDYDEVPSDFSAATDCSDLHFVGWSESSIAAEGTTSAPSLAEIGTKITANKDYYAVFAEGTPGATTWTRVTAVKTLTDGGTFILGYEADATNAKGVIIPMQNTNATATTTANGLIRCGTASDAFNSNTITMSSLGTNGGDNYEITVEAGTASGTIAIKMADNSYIGKPTSGNNAKLFSNKGAGTTDMTPVIQDANNDVIRLKFTNDSSFQYNSSSPRFARYKNGQKDVVFYKKGVTPDAWTKWYTTCPHVERVTLSATTVDHGSIKFQQNSKDVTSVVTTGESDVTVNVVVASHDTGYGLTNVELSGVDGVSYSDGVITIQANATGTLTATATFGQANYTVTLNQTPAAGATLSGATNEAHYGETINLSATNIPSNFLFVNWTSNDVTITNPTSATGASFTMPDGNVTVTANFNEIHNVAWAIENTPSTGTLANVYVKGIVTNIESINTTQYYNASYTISDLDENGAPANAYYVYRGKNVGNTNFTNVNQLTEGDEVIVFGTIKTYQGTKEFDQGNYIIANGRTAASLTSVVVSAPDASLVQTDYYSGDAFSYAGFKATAIYNTGYKKDVTSEVTWKANNAASYTVTAAGTVHVTATLSETTSAAYDVTVAVTTKTLESIELSETSFTGYKGIALPKPATVTAHFDDQGEKSTENVTGSAVFDEDGDYSATSTTAQTITVKYTFGPNIRTADYTVTLSSIENEEGSAYSVTEARDIIDLDQVAGNDLDLANNLVYVEGIITAKTTNEITIKDVTDATKTMVLYKYELGTGITSVDVNDRIKALGALKLYNNTKYELDESCEIVWKQPKVGITIANKVLEVGDVWTINATIDPEEAPVTYSIKVGSDACITLDGDEITATAEGTATIIAHADDYEEYLGNEKEFIVTVKPAATHTNVVLYAEYDGHYYALNNEAGATEINVVGGKVVVANEATKNAIVWDRAENTDELGDYATFYNAAVEKYLTTGSSNSMQVGAIAQWYWNNAGYYSKNSGRTFIYRETASGFKDYSAGNAGTSDYADYTVIYTGEVVVGEITNLRESVSSSKYGTICWPKAGTLLNGSLFEISYYDEGSKKIFFDEIINGEMVAGKPYIFQPNEGVTVLKAATRGEATSDVVPANGLVGSLDAEDVEIPAGENNFILYNNQYWYVDQAGTAYVTPYHAYIHMTGIQTSEPPLAPGRRRVGMAVNGKQTPTGFESINASEKPMKLMIDGQIYILRGQKMYDATGRLVK